MHETEPRPGPAAPEVQTTDQVAMVRPARFAANPETAATNAFQAASAAAGGEAGSGAEQLQARALAEFDGFVAVLRGAGVTVHVFEDTPEPHTPDAIFPNNWVSLHAGGEVVLYPLLAPSRRAEVRRELIAALETQVGVRWPRCVDLTELVRDDEFLEGTGSLVLDRVHRVAYACRSPRTTARALDEFARRLGYELVVFRAVDGAGVPLYHTNVLMGVGAGFALVCLESIANPDERAAVAGRLTATGHSVIPITLEQLGRFAGNILALRSADGAPLTVLSERAWNCLDADQRRRLQRHGRCVHAPLTTIEDHGGGSARCMLLEVHPPPALRSSGSHANR